MLAAERLDAMPSIVVIDEIRQSRSSSGHAASRLANLEPAARSQKRDELDDIACFNAVMRFTGTDTAHAVATIAPARLAEPWMGYVSAGVWPDNPQMLPQLQCPVVCANAGTFATPTLEIGKGGKTVVSLLHVLGNRAVIDECLEAVCQKHSLPIIEAIAVVGVPHRTNVRFVGRDLANQLGQWAPAPHTASKMSALRR